MATKTQKAKAKKISVGAAKKKANLDKKAIDKKKEKAALKKFRQTPPPPIQSSDAVAAEIIKRVREALGPNHLSLENHSEAHKKHPQKKAHGGGHYALFVSTTLFSGLSRIQRSQWVMALLKDLFDSKKIHALKLDLKTPEESPLPEYQPKPIERLSLRKQRSSP